MDDLRNTEAQYAKKNIDSISAKLHIGFVFDTEIIEVNRHTVSHQIVKDEIIEDEPDENDVELIENSEAETTIETIEEAPEREAEQVAEQVVETPVEDNKPEEEKKEKTGFEQISIFDDLD